MEELNAFTEQLATLELGGTDTPASDNALKAVGNFVGSSNPLVLARVIETVGDLARVEANRRITRLCPELVPQLVNTLSSDDANVLKFTLRALGNLSYNNPENRGLIKESGVGTKLIELLRNPLEDIQRNAAGTITNLCSVNDDLQFQLVDQGVLPLLIERLQSSNEGVVSMAARAINNIADSEECAPALEVNNPLPILMDLAFGHSDESVRNDSLCAIVAMTDGSKKQTGLFLEAQGLPKLLAMGRSDEDEDNRKEAFDFIQAFADKEEYRTEFVSELAGLVEDSTKIPTTALETEVQKHSLRILGHLAVGEHYMKQLFELYPRFLELATHEEIDVETKLFVAMIIGNIARQAEYCERLVDDNAATVLLDLAKNGDVRTQHLAVNALHNLSIPEKNKDRVAQIPSMFQTLLNLLETSNNAHVLYAVVLTIKALLRGSEASVKAFLDAEGLSKLDKLFDKELQEGQERIHFEAARALVVLSESKEEWGDLVANNGGLARLSLLVDQEKHKHSLLFLEGLKVFSKAANRPSNREAVLQSGVVPKLVGLLGSEDEEVRNAALVAVANLSVYEGGKEELKKAGAVEKLGGVLSQQSGGTKVVVDKILRLLQGSE